MKFLIMNNNMLKKYNIKLNKLKLMNLRVSLVMKGNLKMDCPFL